MSIRSIVIYNDMWLYHFRISAMQIKYLTLQKNDVKIKRDLVFGTLYFFVGKSQIFSKTHKKSLPDKSSSSLI